MKLSIAPFVCFLLPISLFSQKTETLDLFSMSLEELSTLKVSTSSKKAEKIINAPSIVSIITEDEIRKFGGNDLIDILKRAPAFYDISSMSWRQSTLGVRGDLFDEINPHILFMIDGRPFRDSNKAGLNASLLTAFPLSSIRYIEVIRGPGSVLHGSSAFIAVVNIVTKSGKEKTIDISGRYGSFDTKQLHTSFTQPKGALKMTGGLNYRKTNGWCFDEQFTILDDTVDVNTKTAEEAFGLHGSLAYHGVKAMAFYGQNNMNNVSNRDSLGNLPYKAKKLWIDVGYVDTLLADRYAIQFNATLNRSKDDLTDDETYYPERVTNVDAFDFLVELANHVKVNDKAAFTLGATAKVQTGEVAIEDNEELFRYTTDPYERQWYRGYVQSDYQVNSWLKWVAGGQLNKVEGIPVNFSPRLAILGAFDKGLGFKVLYGEAFRSPNAGENGLITYRGSGTEATATQVGNPLLEPELISTLEPQVFYSSSKVSLGLNYFYSKQKNIIERSIEEGYLNSGVLTSQGLELEWKYLPKEKLYFTGSYTYQTNEDSTGARDIYSLPNHMLKMGVSYHLGDLASFNLFNTYCSQPKVEEGVAGVDQLSNFHWMTAKINVNINGVLGLPNSLQLSLESVNLLDERVKNYVFTKGPARRVLQNQSSRAFYLTFSARF